MQPHDLGLSPTAEGPWSAVCPCGHRPRVPPLPPVVMDGRMCAAHAPPARPASMAPDCAPHPLGGHKVSAFCGEHTPAGRPLTDGSHSPVSAQCSAEMRAYGRTALLRWCVVTEERARGGRRVGQEGVRDMGTQERQQTGGGAT